MHKIEYKLTNKAFIRSMIEFSWPSTKIILFVWSMCAALVLMGFLEGWTYKFLPLVGLTIPFVFPIIQAILVNKNLKHNPLPEKLLFQFDASGFVKPLEGPTTIVSWNDIVRWQETRNFIFLYLSETFFTIVPKDSLLPEQLEELRSYLTADDK